MQSKRKRKGSQEGQDRIKGNQYMQKDNQKVEARSMRRMESLVRGQFTQTRVTVTKYQLERKTKREASLQLIPNYIQT